MLFVTMYWGISYLDKIFILKNFKMLVASIFSKAFALTHLVK